MRTTLLLVAATMTGCTYWAPASHSPAAVLAPREKPVGQIRLRLYDSTRIVLHDHALRGDSVIGYLKSSGGPGTLPSGFIRRAVPLAAIREVQVRRANHAGTFLLVTGIAATAVLVASVPDLSNFRVRIPCGTLGAPCPARITPD